MNRKEVGLESQKPIKTLTIIESDPCFNLIYLIFSVCINNIYVMRSVFFKKLIIIFWYLFR